MSPVDPFVVSLSKFRSELRAQGLQSQVFNMQYLKNKKVKALTAIEVGWTVGILSFSRVGIFCFYS